MLKRWDWLEESIRRMFDHDVEKHLPVLWTRYRPWYAQFEVGWLQPLQLGSSAQMFSVAPMLVSRDRDLCHIQRHPTWFESTVWCSWPVASILYQWTLASGSMSWPRVSYFASWPTLPLPPMPQWFGIQQKRTRVPFSLNNQSRFMIWQIKEFPVSSPSIACKKTLI